MKCPKCGGNAELSNWGSYIDPDYADFHVECKKCGYHSMGSTEPQKAKEMFEKGMGMQYTNEQWLKQCTTEQLAEEIYGFVWCCNELWQQLCCNGDGTDKESDLRIVREWLKQPHTQGETK